MPYWPLGDDMINPNGLKLGPSGSERIVFTLYVNYIWAGFIPFCHAAYLNDEAAHYLRSSLICCLVMESFSLHSGCRVIRLDANKSALYWRCSVAIISNVEDSLQLPLSLTSCSGEELTLFIICTLKWPSNKICWPFFKYRGMLNVSWVLGDGTPIRDMHVKWNDLIACSCTVLWLWSGLR